MCAAPTLLAALQRATYGTIRLPLLQIAAEVTIGGARLKIAPASASRGRQPFALSTPLARSLGSSLSAAPADETVASRAPPERADGAVAHATRANALLSDAAPFADDHDHVVPL
jgi:hypothetical protein